MSDNPLLRYYRGEMKGKELEDWKKWEQETIQKQKEFDRQYMSNKHRNDDKFWNDWSKIHN